ncbi:MAG: endonuclease MutS2, partial [Christensenellaceae bacterium]
MDKLEFHKILRLASDYAVLEGGKRFLLDVRPQNDLTEVNRLLALTAECRKLLFEYGVGKIEYFPPLGDELLRASKGSTLSCGELLAVANLLRSARILADAIDSIADGEIVHIRTLLQNLSFDQRLEDDISTKIVNDEEVSDFASEKLRTIRRDIRLLNERIRSKLSEYLSGDNAKYLQDGIITMRGDRYVLPVKAEYKRMIGGFVHDRSQSGATVFIEPTYILELNNELITLRIDEREEIERILSELSRRVGAMADRLSLDIDVLSEADALFAKAELSYRMKAVRPAMNQKGRIEIVKGRHPLIDPKTVVPVSVALGDKYRFLLVSGPNTGGKTVTLKMVGLFCLMAESGFFVPAADGTQLSVFDEIYSDIGDAQSIEESLSTFSSHVTNLVSIVDAVDERSLVLIDELGGGTDPDEGQALAGAVISYFLDKGCRGIVTTHYTTLKEFAAEREGIENASMAFDAESLRPLYEIRIGAPGASNALGISRRLGLKEEILEAAYRGLSEGGKQLTKILQGAEATRLEAEASLERTRAMERDWAEKLQELNDEREKLRKEREKLFLTAKAEAKRIVSERVAQAEELVEEMEALFDREQLTEGDLIKARTLKNRVVAASYERGEEEPAPQYVPFSTGKVGDRVFVRTMGTEGEIVSLSDKKREAEVLCGSMKLRSKYSELMALVSQQTAEKPGKGSVSPTKKKDPVTVVRKGAALS